MDHLLPKIKWINYLSKTSIIFKEAKPHWWISLRPQEKLKLSHAPGTILIVKKRISYLDQARSLTSMMKVRMEYNQLSM
jgi:hypothetical protein